MTDQSTKVVRVSVCVMLTALLLAAGTTAAFAQSNDEVFPQFQFNFSTPGARANAMGRTFIGVADDSSASITNPAGLTRLTQRQVYFEFKSTDLEVERLAAQDSLVTANPTIFGDRQNHIGFLSLSAPVGERLTVAFTRHQFLSHKETFTLEPRPIPPAFDFAFFPVDGETDFSAVSYAGSIAAVINPKFRLGVTLSIDRLSAEATATRFDFDLPLARNDTVVNQTVIDETATGLSAVIGALIVPNDKVTIGVQFARGATFEVEESLSSNPFFPLPSTQLELEDGFPKDVTINVPNRFGVGVAVRPTSRLLVAADLVRIGYSSLADDFTLIFDADELEPGNYDVDDVSEFHAGAEYLVIPGERRLFVRAGVFSSPDHRTRFTLSPGARPETNDGEVAKYNLLPRETETVGSFGAGIAVGPRFQADFAYVVGREFVASAAVRF
jgi:long-subunit fatty acid transport protein